MQSGLTYLRNLCTVNVGEQHRQTCEMFLSDISISEPVIPGGLDSGEGSFQWARPQFHPQILCRQKPRPKYCISDA